MAQAEVTRNLESSLQQYVDHIVSVLVDSVVLDYQYILELMYTVLHFLRRLLERDISELKHGHGLCRCADILQTRFQWILLLDMAVDGKMKDCFSLAERRHVSCDHDAHCLLDTLQYKYHVLHFLIQFK